MARIKILDAMENKYFTSEITLLRPFKSWSYFSGCPGKGFIYFVGGSLDFFYSFYHSFLSFIQLDSSQVSFQTIQRENFFSCAISLPLFDEEVLTRTIQFLKDEGIEERHPRGKNSYPLVENHLLLFNIFDKEFFYTRSEWYLRKLTHALFDIQSFLSKAYEKDLYLRLMKVNIGRDEEGILAVVLGIKLTENKEHFNEKKVLQAIQSIVPGVVILPGSSVVSSNPKGAHLLIYLEVKKMRGGSFTFHELGKLRKQLVGDLKSILISQPDCIYFPENEESTFHDIARLGSALKSIEDLPQVLITFQPLKGNVIRFNVIVVCANKRGEFSLQSIEKRFPKIVKFIPKHAANIGFISSKYTKQALVFGLEMESAFFLHQNDVIDLVSTRLYLAKALEEVLGPYHDCNSSFHQKQEKLLLSPAEEKISKKSIFKLNFHDGIPPSLNPQLTGDMRAFVLYKALFEGLTRISPDGAAKPAIAETIEISPCEKIYTFHLRRTQWSNGEKLTAHHFAFSWKKALHPYSGCPRADVFYPILNAEKAKKGEATLESIGVQVKNAETLIVTLEKPAPYFLDLLAHPLCSPLYGENSEPCIFNGPFICVSLKPKEVLKLIRNPFYWDTKNVLLDEVEIHSIKDPELALDLFEKEQLDFIGDPFSPISLRSLLDYEVKGELYRKKVWRPYYIYCNTSYFPLNHIKMRQALSFSINRSEIAKELGWDASPLSSPIPGPFSLIGNKESYFDEKRAALLFEEALEEISLSRHQFPPLVFNVGKAECLERLANMLVTQWKNVLGVTIHQESLEWDKLYANFDIGRFQLGGAFQTVRYNDPLFYLKMFKDSSRLINRSGWKNQTYHDLLQEGEQASDLRVGRAFLKEAERCLIEEMPVIPLLNQTYNLLSKKYVNGLVVSDFGYIDLKEISINR